MLYIICTIVALAVGALATFMVQKSLAKSRAKIIIENARNAADVLMKNKILEAREQEMKIKADAEKNANQRLSKIQSQEAKIRQREMQLNQQHSENQRTRNELDGVRSNLESQIAANEMRREELEKLVKDARTQLEYISGLSSDEAKEKLVESLKDEAKTAAASYINDIMDEAKMTANKEAKRIVVQSIQRVATETAIENSLTIFHIDSDEI